MKQDIKCTCRKTVMFTILIVKVTIELIGGEVLKIIIQAVVLLVLAKLIPGLQIEGLFTSVFAVLFFSLLNATVGLILKLVSFPLNFLTFGLFNFIINAIILKLTSVFFSSFNITFPAALIVSVILAIVASVLEAIK